MSDFAPIEIMFAYEGWRSEIKVDGKRIPVTGFKLETDPMKETTLTMQIAAPDRGEAPWVARGYFVDNEEMEHIQSLRAAARCLVNTLTEQPIRPRSLFLPAELVAALRDITRWLDQQPSLVQKHEAAQPGAAELWEYVGR